MIDLLTLGGEQSYAQDVSADGAVIVGYSHTGDAIFHAFKYTGSTMTDLGTLGLTDSYAHGVSGDGSVIVGGFRTSDDSTYHAFKYTGSSMTDLGTLSGGTFSYARDVSANGSTIVGYADILGGAMRAFKYTGSTMTDLGTLGGTDSYAYGISADGSTIVGKSHTEDNVLLHAFVYRNSMLDIDNTYAALATSSHQLNAVINTQANLLGIALNHDCTVYGADNLCIAVGGAYNTVNHENASQTTANLRVGYQVAPNVHVGVFVDQSAANSMPSNYDLKKDMPLVGAFASWSQNTNGLGAKIKASLAYSKRDLDITRSTLANTEAGQGSSRISSKGAQIEAAWGVALNDDWTAEPFAGMRVSKINRDSYQENDEVDFPISYHAVKQTATTAYMGARFIGQLTPAVTARLAAGVESDIHHRISDHTGTIDTLGDYALAAPNMLHSRGFLNGSLDYTIAANQTLNAMLAVNQNALNHALGASAMASYLIGF